MKMKKSTAYRNHTCVILLQDNSPTCFLLLKPDLSSYNSISLQTPASIVAFTLLTLCLILSSSFPSQKKRPVPPFEYSVHRSFFFTFSDFLSLGFPLQAIFCIFSFNLNSPISLTQETIPFAFPQKSQLTLLLVLFFQVVLPLKKYPRSSIMACSSQIFKTISVYSITRVVGSFLLQQNHHLS